MPDCIIVEDEPIAADVIEKYLEAFDEFRLIGRFSNPIKAIPFVMENQVDLMFLDIQMPGMNGFELISAFRVPPHVIFTTAHPDYALNGYEVNAIDYLLKPIAFARFVAALNKARGRLNAGQAGHDHVEPQVSKAYRLYKSEGKIVRVDLHRVQFIEAMENYVKFVTDDDTIVVQCTMKSLEADLSEADFMRVHRSYIVNLSHLRAVDRNVIEILDSKIPVGRAYRSVLNDYVSQKLGHLRLNEASDP